MRDSATTPPMMVLCLTCGGAVEIDAPCATCGVSDPQGAPAPPIADSELLERVGEALAAQGELAKKTATERAGRRGELYEQALVLRARLRRQWTRMRQLTAERRELQRRLAETMSLVQVALRSQTAIETPTEAHVVHVLLPRDRSCSAVARRVVEDRFSGEVARQTIDDALLIVSELATNALLHGQGTIGLRVARREDSIGIEVSDEGRAKSIDASNPIAEAGGGRGLWLVDRVSAAWGAETDPVRVWAELAAR